MQRAKEAAEVVGRNAAIRRMISGGGLSKALTSGVDISTRSASFWAGISDCSLGELARGCIGTQLWYAVQKKTKETQNPGSKAEDGLQSSKLGGIKVEVKYRKVGETTFALGATYVYTVQL